MAAIDNEERSGGERAGNCDHWIRKTIPGYTAPHDMAMFFIQTGMDAPKNPRLLCGTT